jgi:hypothetical protein
MPTAAYFHSQAQRCRRLASTSLDEAVARTLRQMAAEYEQEAHELAQTEQPQTPGPIVDGVPHPSIGPDAE